MRSRSASRSAGSVSAGPADRGAGGKRGCARAFARALVVLVAVAGGACASAPPKIVPRAPTDDDRRQVARALGPLLRLAGLYKGPGNGCDAALGVAPTPMINVGVGPHPTCTLTLLVTEGALATLPFDELQAAFAHEIGHAQLGHFASRQDRRIAERDAHKKIEERGSTAGAVATAIPVIGPLLAIAVIGTQSAAQSATEGTYRGYDQAEERAADRFAVDLLNRLPGDPRCHALTALLERLDRARSGPPWRGWLSTHPSPADRLEAVRSVCP